jgi:hypothetical protein
MCTTLLQTELVHDVWYHGRRKKPHGEDGGEVIINPKTMNHISHPKVFNEQHDT